MGKKFDFVIGNPPYQETVEGTSDKPVYNEIMDAAFKIGDKVEFITPGRFLFNAGKTPKEWNQERLSDPHFKVLDYEQDSSIYFPNTDIKGGVAITYRDPDKDYGAIGVFSLFKELNSIARKVSQDLKNGNFSDLMFLQNRFDLETLYNDYPEYRKIISSNGRERRIVTSSFEKLGIFHDSKDGANDVELVGIVRGNRRVRKWADEKYISDNGNFHKWKVLVPAANGSGALGEVLSTPLIGSPLIGYTQSFIGIGAFDDEDSAGNVLKYVKTKFARVLLGILKITQHNTPEKWIYVPLQDFSNQSEIDWSKSIIEIDQQLYKKYNLSPEEIDFIETNVKEMN